MCSIPQRKHVEPAAARSIPLHGFGIKANEKPAHRFGSTKQACCTAPHSARRFFFLGQTDSPFLPVTLKTVAVMAQQLTSRLSKPRPVSAGTSAVAIKSRCSPRLTVDIRAMRCTAATV